MTKKLLITLLTLISLSSGLAQRSEKTNPESIAVSDSYSKTATEYRLQPIPKENPADYGANSKGELIQDAFIETSVYELPYSENVTTNSHGIIIYATNAIYINGTINVKGLGGLGSYPNTRDGLLSLYSGYGDRNLDGEYVLWGKPCDNNQGGGYAILHAPYIEINGVIDASGNDCAQAGIIYLEGHVNGEGRLLTSKLIKRGL